MPKLIQVTAEEMDNMSFEHFVERGWMFCVIGNGGYGWGATIKDALRNCMVNAHLPTPYEAHRFNWIMVPWGGSLNYLGMEYNTPFVDHNTSIRWDAEQVSEATREAIKFRPMPAGTVPKSWARRR